MEKKLVILRNRYKFEKCHFHEVFTQYAFRDKDTKIKITSRQHYGIERNFQICI